jgi:hypothetical protein
VQFSFAEEDGGKKHVLVAGIGCSTFFFFIYVAIKHGKPNEEGQADEVFHAFDVRVIIYQGENFLDFAY